MSILLFTNNFSTTLASSIGTGDTSITLLSATGLPTPSGDEYFKLSLSNSDGTLNEIVNCTALVGNVATVVRAQEGTTAQSWAAGSIVGNRWTAGSAEAMQQTAQAQAQSANYAVAGGTANDITATFTPALTSHVIGMPLRIKIMSTNTGAVILNPGPSVVAVTGPNGNPLVAGDLVASDIVTFVYNGVSYLVQNVQASTTRIGISRLATVAEAQTGTSQVLAVTPAGLAAVAGAINSVIPGSLLMWPNATAPSGYLECNGSALSTTTYADLFAVLGYSYGGSGSTFTLPDFRGWFARGWSHGSSVDSGRAINSYQLDAYTAHSHSLTYYNDNSGGSGPGHGGGSSSQENTANSGTGTETRPRNIAVMFCIKY